jgi:hypothetical protein
MSTPFFNTPERLAALDAAWPLWMGTPFAHLRRGVPVRGPRGGANCHALCWGVLTDAGWSMPIDLPLVSSNHAKHHTEEIMLEWFRAHPQIFLEITPAEVALLQPGDLIPQKYGLVTHHLSLTVTRSLIIETFSGKQAGTRALADADATKRMQAIFRPLEIAA